MKNKKDGFTLIELLVVISIIGILMGLLISQLGGVLGTSENTKMQAIMRSWIVQLKEYHAYYGYYPPFMYEATEGTPILLNEPGDNQQRLYYSLTGKENIQGDWEVFENENRDEKEFHTFSDDEFDADGDLVGYASMNILVDYDRDGKIKLESDTVDKILASLSADYDDEEMSLVQLRKEQFSIINEEIAFYILADTKTGLSNIFSWNIEKYFEE